MLVASALAWWTLVSRCGLASGSWSLFLHHSTVHSTMPQLFLQRQRSLRFESWHA
jgi:hypothetical protein